MIRLIILVLVMFMVVVGAYAQEDMPEPSALLEGWAVLPADTFEEGPAAGAFITNPAEELNGRAIPFESQPVQGFSAILPAGNGNWLVLSDNGFGSKANSADYHLRFYEVAVDFAAKTVEVVGFTELSDPNGMIPFPIVNNDTEDRILTGADFDVESFRQLPDGTFFFGDELGPWLLHTDATGVVIEAPIPTPYPTVLAPYARGLEYIQAPQNPAFADLATPEEQAAAANHRTSRGFEGMALSVDGAMLYPMLEGSMVDDPFANRVMIREFDIAAGEYTDRYFFYALDAAGHAIGDFTAINENQFLVIERDNNQGEAAAFKRVYVIDLSQAAPDGAVRKTLLVDLLNIGDPNGITAPEEGAIGFGEVFSFPFQTIESIYPIDADTLILANDNNYPFSSGRRPGVDADNNEFILITLPEALDLAE